MTRHWTRIVLKGRAQVIPAVCPNCLGEADMKLRYGYKGLQGWVTRTTYYQTFAYCRTCHPQAASAAGLRRWGVFAVVVAVFAAILAAVVISGFLRDPVTGVCTPFRANLAVALAAAAGLAAGMLTFLVAKFVKRRRHPLRPEQAVWGRAAFYAGGARWGLDSSTSVYLAARPQWAAALARSNPEQLDDQAYHQATGENRPVLAPERPFGPA